MTPTMPRARSDDAEPVSLHRVVSDHVNASIMRYLLYFCIALLHR